MSNPKPWPPGTAPAAVPGLGSPWRTAALYGGASLLLLWPLALNGDYFYFHDTAAYLRYPAEAFEKLFGIEPLLSAAPASPSGPAPGLEPAALPAPAAGAAGDTGNDTVAAGRSIYYGGMLYVGALAGGLWIGVLAQLAAVALAVYLTLDGLLGEAEDRPDRRRAFPLVMAGLAVASPLPFFVGYLMPDVFAGIAILAVANLCALEVRPASAGGARLPERRRLVWFGLLATALLFHSSHTVVVVLMLLPAVVVARLLQGRLPWRAMATVAVAVAVALAGEALFAQAVTAVYGTPPLRPPFLMARMISDGPGTAYLMTHCPEIGLAICDWRSRLPLDTDSFLWSKDQATGVYGVADAATRRNFDAEQGAFIRGVLTTDPLGQLAASLRGFAEQLHRVGLHEFAYDDTLRATLPAMLPVGEAQAFTTSGLYRGTFPLGPADWLVRAGLAASAIVLVGSVLRPRLGQKATPETGLETGSETGPETRGGDRTLLAFAVILLGGVVANAAVTGILSTPHDRYQARVIWLVPLLAMIVFLHLRWRPAPTTRP